MANYFNYSISFGKGKLYLKSSEPKDGYEEVIYQENKKTYHKYVDQIKGQLKYFDVKEAEFQGKKLSFLELTLIDGEDNNKVSVPLKNAKGNYTDEVKALVSSLNAAEVGEEVTLTVKKSTSTGKNGKEYTNLNIYIKYVNKLGENGKGLSTGFISYTDIPAPDKEEDEDLGTLYSWKPVNKFYAQKIREIKEKFESGKSNTPSTPKQEAPKENFVGEKEYDNQELPF